MILRVPTPRSLAWPSWAGLCGAGLLLLPLVPTRAQQAAPEKRPEPDQQRIEQAIRKATEYLALEQQTDNRADSVKPQKDTKAIHKARAEVDQARAKLKAAKARLASLEGKPVRLRVRLDTHTAPVKVLADTGATRVILQEYSKSVGPIPVKPNTAYVIVQDGSKLAGPAVIRVLPSRTPTSPERPQIRVEPPRPVEVRPSVYAEPARPIEVRPPVRTVPRLPASVDEKLDRLQREIGELRKELKQQRAGDNGQRSLYRLQFHPAPTLVPPSPARTSSAAPAPAFTPLPQVPSESAPSAPPAPPQPPAPSLAAAPPGLPAAPLPPAPNLRTQPPALPTAPLPPAQSLSTPPPIPRER